MHYYKLIHLWHNQRIVEIGMDLWRLVSPACQTGSSQSVLITSWMWAKNGRVREGSDKNWIAVWENKVKKLFLHSQTMHWKNTFWGSSPFSSQLALGRVFLFTSHSLSLLCYFPPKSAFIIWVHVCCKLWAPLLNLCIHKLILTSFVQSQTSCSFLILILCFLILLPMQAFSCFVPCVLFATQLGSPSNPIKKGILKFFLNFCSCVEDMLD